MMEQTTEEKLKLAIKSKCEQCAESSRQYCENGLYCKKCGKNRQFSCSEVRYCPHHGEKLIPRPLLCPWSDGCPLWRWSILEAETKHKYQLKEEL